MGYLEYERSVYYYETDQMKIVHHSNYIRWFEEARIYWMEKMGMPYNKMEELGIIIPVVDVYAKYKKMVSFGQTVLIRLKIKEFNGVKASFEYEIYDKESKELCTTGFSTHCFLDEKMRPVNIKKKFPEIYDIFNATK